MCHTKVFSHTSLHNQTCSSCCLTMPWVQIQSYLLNICKISLHWEMVLFCPDNTLIAWGPHCHWDVIEWQFMYIHSQKNNGVIIIDLHSCKKIILIGNWLDASMDCSQCGHLSNTVSLTTLSSKRTSYIQNTYTLLWPCCGKPCITLLLSERPKLYGVRSFWQFLVQ